MWQSLYSPTGRDGYPPVAVVFDPGTRLGEQALKNRMNRVLDLTRVHWSGKYQKLGGYGSEPDGYVDYGDAIPVLFTTLDRIQDCGPLAPVWWRCGHRRWETLPDALDNPQDRRAWRRREAGRSAARKEQEAWERKEGSAAAGDWSQRHIPAQPEPALPPPPPCQVCGSPLKGLGGEDPSAPPSDGRTCEACRIAEAAQPATGLFKVLLGRQDKHPRDEPPAWL
ncbi:hypothetical protein ABZV80_42290 [Streptomyces sp. NPDC005132]|uniref:hypothetical protein n=1 Tax=Streptomyces sp. NPDC005132 TaxID=3154294 RepID=UPI0033A14C2E